ncbi:hypothetical protein D3C81_1840110 [compost metagenome]
MVLTGGIITARRDNTALHTAHAGLDINAGCQALRRELVLGQMFAEATRIEEYRVSAHWLNNRHTGSF